MPKVKLINTKFITWQTLAKVKQNLWIDSNLRIHINLTYVEEWCTALGEFYNWRSLIEHIYKVKCRLSLQWIFKYPTYTCLSTNFNNNYTCVSFYAISEIFLYIFVYISFAMKLLLINYLFELKNMIFTKFWWSHWCV